MRWLWTATSSAPCSSPLVSPGPSVERGHRTVTVMRKGGKVVTMPLAPRVARALDLAIGDRAGGPVFLAVSGRRMDRHAASRIVRRVARAAGLDKHISPHTLRHGFITCATRRHQPGGVKGPAFGLSQQPVEAESSLILGGTGLGGSSSDKAGTAGHRQTGRDRRARRIGVRVQEPAVEPPQERDRLEPGGSGPGSSARPPSVGDSDVGCDGRPGGHGESLRRSRGEAAGEELGTNPVERLMVNVGTAARSPYLLASQAGGGKACRRLMAWWRGGGPVVVRGRESRLHGEGAQRACRLGTGMPGGRR
jgi:hypothetical protein